MTHYLELEHFLLWNVVVKSLVARLVHSLGFILWGTCVPVSVVDLRHFNEYDVKFNLLVARYKKFYIYSVLVVLYTLY